VDWLAAAFLRSRSTSAGLNSSSRAITGSMVLLGGSSPIRKNKQAGRRARQLKVAGCLILSKSGAAKLKHMRRQRRQAGKRHSPDSNARSITALM
jgi:hypothetical protein